MAPPPTYIEPSAAQYSAASLSIAPSLRSRRSGRSVASNGLRLRPVMVSGEVFAVVHQVTDALLQVTHQNRDDAVARERLLLQQQQLLQRDFIDKEMKDRELAYAEKQKLMEKELKEEQLQFEREQKAAEAGERDKQLQFEREKNEKQLLFEREKVEKQAQLEREIKAAEAMEREKQLLVQKELKEREIQAGEKQKLLEFAERDRERIKQEFEAKLELNLQLAEEKRRNVQLQMELSNSKLTQVRSEELLSSLLADVGDNSLNVDDAENISTPHAPSRVEGKIETSQSITDSYPSPLVEIRPSSSFAGVPPRHASNCL